METPIEEMTRHAAIYVKQQTQLSFEEALSLSVPGAAEKYVISELVAKITVGYHHNKSSLLTRLFRALHGRGVDVVDECEEDIYRCVMNVEDDGDDFVSVAHAKEVFPSRGKGLLSTLKLGHDGVMSDRYGGVAAFADVLKRHGL